MKTRFGLVCIGVLAMALGGCAKGEVIHAETAPSGYAAPPGAAAADDGYPAPAPAFANATPAPAAAAPAAPSTPALGEEHARAPAQRPGLGTEWGEARYSQVHEEPFSRASDDPFALASVRYDDRSGVEAMVARRGHPRTSRDVTVAGGWIAMTVRGERGQALDAVRVGDRTYVVGRAGERYSIVLSNRTGRRFEAVATVDGLDVINGLTGSTSNRGYLLEPHATLAIDGFRQSDATVAAFRFGRVADSYAAQTGSARDVGVIGVAFFSEQGDELRASDALLRDSADPFPASDCYARPPL